MHSAAVYEIGVEHGVEWQLALYPEVQVPRGRRLQIVGDQRARARDVQRRRRTGRGGNINLLPGQDDGYGVFDPCTGYQDRVEIEIGRAVAVEIYRATSRTSGQRDRVVARIEWRDGSAFVGDQVADSQCVINATAEPDRGLAVLPGIPGEAESRREIILVNRRRRAPAWQDRADQGGLFQIIVERVRINLIARAEIERQVREQAPGVFTVKRSSRVAVRIVGRAGNANALLVPQRRVDEGLVDDIRRIPRGRRDHVELRGAVDEVEHSDAIAHRVHAAAQRVPSAYESQVVAELIEALKGGLRRDAVRAGDEQAVVGKNPDVFQSGNTDGLRLRRGAQHAVFEICARRAKGVGQPLRQDRIQTGDELMRRVGVDVPAGWQPVAAES